MVTHPLSCQFQQLYRHVFLPLACLHGCQVLCMIPHSFHLPLLFHLPLSPLKQHSGLSIFCHFVFQLCAQGQGPIVCANPASAPTSSQVNRGWKPPDAIKWAYKLVHPNWLVGKTNWLLVCSSVSSVYRF